MDNERSMELLQEIVVYTLMGRNLYDGIEKLLKMGFRKEELVNHFHFSEEDVRYVIGKDI